MTGSNPDPAAPGSSRHPAAPGSGADRAAPGSSAAATDPAAPPASNGAEPTDDQATRIAVAAARAQAAARRRLRGPEPDEGAPLAYVGLITRIIAFTVDAAIVLAVAGLVWVSAVLTINLLNLGSDSKAIIVGALGFAFILWSAGYFVTFWATTGQTPGSRLLQIRVVRLPGLEHGMPPRRAILRLVVFELAAIPLGAGIWGPILLTNRRQGLHDVVARTVVIEAPVLSDADRRRIAAEQAGVPPPP